MKRFKDVVGHGQIIEHFQHGLNTQKISHAYIVNGEAGSGKKMLANIFAAALQCEKQGGEPCMECTACRQIDTGNHPDVIYVTHEKPGSIGVEDVRNQINGDIQIKPYRGPYKIYIIEEADKLTVQAQNALLKTIEEPPAYAVILLLTEAASGLLATVLSRCVILNLKPVKDADIKKYLIEELKVPDYQADVSVAFARGNLGKAVKLASSEDFNNMKETVLKLLRHLDEMEIYEISEWLKQMSGEKLNIFEYLDLMMIWYRDTLLYKATQDINSLIFKNEIKAIQKQANKSSYQGIETILKAIEKAKVRLRANVNFELAMELLLLTIKEN